MRRILKWTGYGLLCALVLSAAAAFWKREQIARLLAVNSLFEADRIVTNFSNMDTAFLTTPVALNGTDVSPLTQGQILEMPQGYEEWLKARNVTSILVMKDGAIVHEDYFQGTRAQDTRISWSVAKSYLSALLGIVLEEGDIASLDDQVTTYAPELIGSAYEGVTIRNALQMSSGVTFDEDYLDYDSDINRMGRVLALGGAMDTFAADLTETFAAPGSDWQYVSIDTHVIGMVVRGATERAISDLLSEKIIAPLGLEKEPYYLTDGEGVAFVLGGLNVTTRDYARFGQMILNGGVWNGKRIVPADWIAESTKASAATDPGRRKYGYQWWMPADAAPGEFFAYGIYGQYIYFNTDANVVIVRTAADRAFREAGVRAQDIEMFRRIAGQ